MADSLRSLLRFVRTVGAATACFAGLAIPLGAQVTGSPEPEVVVIRWPKLQPLPAIDKEVRVGLQMAPDLATKNLTGYSVRVSHQPPGGTAHFDYFLYSEPQHPAGSDETAALREVLVIDLAQALEKRLREVVHALFPSSKTSSPADGTDVDLLLRADMDTRWQEHADGNIVGIEVHLQLELLAPSGERLETLRLFGFSQPEDRRYWSSAARWRSVALEAMSLAIDQLVDGLRESPILRAALSGAAEARSLPAGLQTELELDDREALLPNGRLDAGEEALVHVRLTNRGPGPAIGITLKAIPDSPGVSAPAPQTLGSLAPQAGRELTFAVAGGLDLPAGVLHLRVETAEKRGYDGRPVILEIPTAPLRRPSLEIVDVAWNDRDGRGRGDGDGQPSNGETLEAVVRLRNAGPGDAAGVVVSIASPPPGVELVEPRTTLRRIPANSVGEARVVVRLPVAYTATELGLAFDAVDGRGPQAGRAADKRTWAVRVKRPAVAIAHRFYDGSSPSSSGNRDDRVNNGERIELVLTATNRGELPARELHVAVATGDRRLVATPATFDLHDLPEHSEGGEQRLVLDVPRGFGEPNATDLRLTLKITQLDFPAQEVPISLPFHQLRPDFAVEAAGAAAIARGTSSTVALQLLNPGELPAEDVAVEVAAPAGGVDLLDEHGVPTAKRRFTIGSLAPSGGGARLSLPLLAKQGAEVGAHPLSIGILQRDFPSAAREVNVAVTAGDGPVVTPARPAPLLSTTIAPLAGAPPPMISFLRFTDGDRVSAATVVLGFEVQSSAEPADVRATQDGRLLTLDGRRRDVGGEGGPQVARYELPVELAPGGNHFEVVVVTREGLRRERTLSLVREARQGRMWVVAIGVGSYSDPAIEALHFAAADARSVYDYFASAFALPAEQRFLLVDQQATLRAIKSLLGTRLAAQANNPEDTIILYFAGHGLAEAGTGSIDADRLSKYLLPYDAELADPYSTALDVDEVTTVVRRLVPERVVVIIDSCFSGAAGGRSPFDPRHDRLRGVVTDEFLDRMVGGKGRIVLTASGANEAARERNDLGHGIFTYYLLRGLTGDGDENHDGQVDVDELYRFVWDRVTAATAGKQNPVKRAPQSEGPIVLGRTAVPTAPVSP